jgi:hypothetical protein
MSLAQSVGMFADERAVARLRSLDGTIGHGTVATAFHGRCKPVAWRISLASSCKARRSNRPASFAISNNRLLPGCPYRSMCFTMELREYLRTKQVTGNHDCCYRGASF